MAKGKNTLNGLKQTHGALSTPLSIEELTGMAETYPVATLAQYKELLASMTDEDMRQHAIDVAGIVPIDNRSLLIERLETKFVSANRRAAPIVPPSKMSKKDQDFQRRFHGGDL